MILQLVEDLNQAHDVICKLQGLDPEKHDWPEWSPQANTIRWFEELFARKLAKTEAWTLFPSEDKARPVRPHRSGGKMFRVWSKEYEEYDEDCNQFFVAPDGELFWMDECGLHKADPAQYEIVIERAGPYQVRGVQADKGRPVRPHRSGGGMVLPPLRKGGSSE